MLKKCLSICALIFVLQTPLAYAEWSEARSDNFVFVGEVSERRARKTVKELEIFRTSIFRIFGWEYGVEPLPVRVYGARSRNDIKKILGRSGITGAYKTDSEGPTFILNMNGGRNSSDTRTVAFHEFVHHLTNTYGHNRFPTWYNEGFAEYLSTFEIKKSDASLTRVIVGTPSQGRGWSISNEERYDWDEFIYAVRGYPSDVNTRRSRGRAFYAQAWLAAHYIQSTDGFPEKLGAYLALLNAPDAPDDAFERTFEMSPSEFGSLLERYVKRDKYPGQAMNFGESFRISEITTRKLTKGEAAFYEGEAFRTFHQSNNQTSNEGLSEGLITAEEHYAKAVEAGGPVAQINASRGLMAIAAKDFATAQTVIEAAIALAPDSSRVLYIASLAHYARYADDSTPRQETDIEAARAYSLRAMHANPDNMSAHFIHALSFANPGNAPSLQAVSSAKDSSTYFRGDSHLNETFLLANLLLKGNEPEDARRILGDINNWSRSARARSQAQKMIDHLNVSKILGADPSQEIAATE